MHTVGVLVLFICIPWYGSPCCLFIQSVDGHLGGGFHFSAITDKPAVDIHVQLCVHIYFHFSWVNTWEWSCWV